MQCNEIYNIVYAFFVVALFPFVHKFFGFIGHMKEKLIKL